MAGPDYGALGAAFKVTRVMQAASMIAIIGMTSNFIAEMITAQLTPPSVLIGTLSIVCVAVLYCLITVILLLDGILPFLISTAIDGMFLIALVVVAVLVGKPLSYANCDGIGDITNGTSSAYDFTAALTSMGKDGKINYASWIGISKGTCLEMKSIWGLVISLCIMFTLSAFTSIILWKQGKSAAAAHPKSEV